MEKWRGKTYGLLIMWSIAWSRWRRRHAAAKAVPAVPLASDCLLVVLNEKPTAAERQYSRPKLSYPELKDRGESNPPAAGADEQLEDSSFLVFAPHHRAAG